MLQTVAPIAMDNETRRCCTHLHIAQYPLYLVAVLLCRLICSLFLDRMGNITLIVALKLLSLFYRYVGGVRILYALNNLSLLCMVIRFYQYMLFVCAI